MANVDMKTTIARRSRAMARMTQRLYVRIWLAVVVAVAVLTFLVGWAWQMASDPPLREVFVRNAAGEVVGSGALRGRRGPRGEGPPPGADARPRAPESEAEGDDGPPRNGPEFAVSMRDGEMLTVHLPRPPRNFWNRPPFGFFWTLGLVGVAVALATYPIIRKLTRRLEELRTGVEQWGRGDLSARVSVGGADEVAFLARRFNQSAERIEQLVKSHKSLLANASHELRSPLARIRMGLELMNPAGSMARDEISRNIGELDQLIDEILLASRLDADEVDIGTVEMVDLVGLTAEECAHTGAELDIAEGEVDTVEARGVSRLLRRAVRNLLENARRYGQGEIVASVRREGDNAVLRVSDRGPGVPPELRERIFEPFYRLPGASEREGGVGLGLALVKSIAERHGGTVRCEGREGGGASFVIVLPHGAPSR